MKKIPSRRWLSGLLRCWPLSAPLSALWLAGCAMQPPAPPLTLAIPAQWQAPLPPGSDTTLPHQGSLNQLSQWWQQQNDALLVKLIMAAEAVSPSIVSARSNIEQARAARVASGAALRPSLDATGALTRGLPAPVNRAVPPLATTAQLGLQASWEIDLFGQHSASRDADQQRLVGSQAMWHAARVSVAAEVASQYYSLRACEKLLAVTRADAASRAETARLTALGVKAGFQAPANAALARASAAEGHGNAIQQSALCDLDVKALVALTGLAESDLRQQLAQALDDSAPEAMAPLISVPAQVLAQRPDIFNAAREVDAAHAEVGSALAHRYPRLTLTGAIARSQTVSRGASLRYDTWSVGPLQLTLPLLDGGASAANVEAARARYDNAAAQYRGSVRQAVKEVEEALIHLQSSADRKDDAEIAASGYASAFKATQARYQSGMASLVELEETRRSWLAAQSAVVSLQRERRSAWVALYRALGGGWSTASPPPPPLAADSARASAPAPL
ncbi:efflux transporter, outer membrane factor (OMF) lipoprotein, NodT family [Polaromonas sp. OV174]|uniref:efflux transporter outer membrane subunit n=1 Tax=Polaromonas sp. OV174 TaxID=1855300 RepID=UPI0008EAFD67|nr:efflux transporter outer membrane subunit [Polaromonas sp. OV174]SFC29892.1 efflux transporter, outer membrane factor (OMF) lipoprotein, NodT family [Polaromonas sp. OV174]